MKSPGLVLLLLAVAAVSGSPATAEQPSKTSESLKISVTVDPTCTVAVMPVESEPEGAVKVACRNMRDGQPEPIVFETAPRDGHDVMWIRF